MAKYDVTVFLMKETINDFDEAIKENIDELSVYKIREIFDTEGVVYAGENKTSTPEWNNLLNEGVINYEEQWTMSTRAVVFIKRKERIFAFTFGYGRHMLKNDSYVRGFGFRVILNNARDGSIKSVDTSVIDETPLNSKIQSSKSVLLNEFNITDIRTMFRAVTAESNDENKYGGVISGKDSFGFNHTFNFSNVK